MSSKVTLNDKDNVNCDVGLALTPSSPAVTITRRIAKPGVSKSSARSDMTEVFDHSINATKVILSLEVIHIITNEAM